MKRIFLFLLTNLAAVLLLSIIAHIFNVDQFLSANGLDLSKLLVFSVIMGFGGAIFCLLMSKMMAKFSTGAKVLTAPSNSSEIWLVGTVARLAHAAGLTNTAELAIYDGATNAFATGPSKSNALVAISTGLLETMERTLGGLEVAALPSAIASAG